MSDMRHEFLRDDSLLPWSSSGAPSFVQVYWILVGFPVAVRLITNVSSSIPTAVDDGGGMNFGGTVWEWMKNKF